MDLLFYLGRLLYGGFFIKSAMNHFMNVNALSGYAASKKVPMPKLAVLFSGLLIFLGGLWVVTGIFVQVGVIELAAFLIPVSFMMHDYWNDTDMMTKMGNRTNFMKNMALLGAALMLLQIPANPALYWGWSPF